MLKVALFGYGKMGKEIEKVLLERGHQVSHKITSKDHIEQIDFTDTDVVIEFSTPHAAKKNIEFCINHQLPIVVGTTAWYEYFNEIESLVKQKNGSLLYATNFSLGVNLFFAVNKYMAKLMNQYPDYSCSVKEIHHTEKLDAPSGTGISTAEQIIAEMDQLDQWENVKKSETSGPHVLALESERLPKVPGTHVVCYENEIDKIELTHTAHSRKGFALGSVIAAEWLVGKHGIFTMNNVLNL